MNRLDKKNLRVLELGAGIGGVSRILATKYDCEVTAIDYLYEHVEVNKQINKMCGINNIRAL